MNTDRYKKAKNTPISPNKQVLAEDFYFIMGFVPNRTRSLLSQKIDQIAQYLGCEQDCSGRRNTAGGAEPKKKGVRPRGRPSGTVSYKVVHGNAGKVEELSLEEAAKRVHRSVQYIQQQTCKGKKLHVDTNDEDWNPDVLTVSRITP